MRNRLSSSLSRWALLALLLIGVPAWAQGPPLVCSVSVPNPQNLRGTGQSELVADILISCVNGTPAFDYKASLKSSAVFKRLPELEKRLQELEALVNQLKRP